MNLAKVTLHLIAIFGITLAQVEHHHEGENHHESSYEFKYGVEDPHTGDYHTHQEHKHGKEVSGIYTLKEADGTTRVVKYHAGPHTGFNAEVERIGHAQHPAHHGHHHHEALGESSEGTVESGHHSDVEGGNIELGVEAGHGTLIEVGDQGVGGHQGGSLEAGQEQFEGYGGQTGGEALGDHYQRGSSYVGTTHYRYKQ